MQTEIICQIQSVKGAPSVQETLNGIDAKKKFARCLEGRTREGLLYFTSLYKTKVIYSNYSKN